MQILDSGFNCLSISKLRSEPIAYRARNRPGDEPHSGPLLIVPGAGNTFHVTNIMQILRCTSLRSGRRLHSIRHPDSTLPLPSHPDAASFSLPREWNFVYYFFHTLISPRHAHVRNAEFFCCLSLDGGLELEQVLGSVLTTVHTASHSGSRHTHTLVKKLGSERRQTNERAFGRISPRVRRVATVARG